MARQKVKCIVSDKEVILTEEEKVRQDYLKRLIDDYGYKKEDIKTEYYVKKSPSDIRKSLPVDIAIFENGKAKIFVETKKPTIDKGEEQLKNYMDFDPDVRYGVWTNGNIDDGIGILFIEKITKIKKGKNATIEYKNIFDIPRKGFSTCSEQIQKKDLKKTQNLKNIFKQMRGFIAANATGTTRDEKILNELMSILICKIYDEKFKSENDYMDFRVIDDNAEETAKMIKRIFDDKVKTKYPMVFKKTDEISLSNIIITHLVAQLQYISITESSHQVVSDAFESIISYATKGSQGQFFTPKNIIELMINILEPERYKSILDPACGTAGFLTSAMNYIWNQIDSTNLEILAKAEEKKDYAMQYLFGIEKDDFLAKISKAYMAILGDGKSGIFIEDSLNIESWSEETKIKIKNDSFDYVLTNPPFGKDIKVQDETKEKFFSEKVYLIFLERSLEFLKDGGILGIILPETPFHSPTNIEIRNKFFYSHNIKCIIDLPHNTFRPFNNAKCNVIFIQKNRKQQNHILAIKIDNIGHDHDGKPTYKYDIKTNTFNPDIIQEDISGIISLLTNKEYMQMKLKEVNNELSIEQLEKLKCNEYDKNIKFLNAENVKNKDLLVARSYFDIDFQSINSISLEELINEKIIMFFDGHGSPAGHLKGLGEYPYIRVKDIVNLEVYINPLDLIPKFEYDRLYSKLKEVKEKDIVFVRRGSYRIGDVGILYKKDLNSIFTREILILRVIKEQNKYNITPFNLLFLLNSNLVKEQLANKILIDTTLPNIADRWYDQNEMERINIEMTELYYNRQKFWENLNKVKPDIFKIGL